MYYGPQVSSAIGQGHLLLSEGALLHSQEVNMAIG